jgi:exonuclease III
MSEQLCPIATWNPRGLNMPARRTAVCEIASAARLAILCLQETKLDHIDRSLAVEIAGTDRQDFFFLPAEGTRGGAAIFWDASVVSLTLPVIRRFSVTATVTVLHSNTSFLISTVYGPSEDADKVDFLAEMTQIKPAIGTPWLILGDFNLIYEARDKNNLNLCRRLMGQFRAAIDAAELFEMRCSNRRFSWSNEREQPTLVYLDRVFCNVAWDGLFSTCAVQALSSSHSDHCPMMISSLSISPRPARFRFENFWPEHPGFLDTVITAWTAEVGARNPLRRLQIKLRRTARALKFWETCDSSFTLQTRSFSGWMWRRNRAY